MSDHTNPGLHFMVYLWGNQLPADSASFLFGGKKKKAPETAGVCRFTYILT